MKPPLLFLCHRIPYPPNKGDKIRSFHLLHHLSQHFDVFLGGFIDDPADNDYVSDVEKYCREVKLLPLNPLRAKLRSLSGLLTGEVLSLPYYRSAELQQWIDDTVPRVGIEHVLVFSSAMAQYALGGVLQGSRRVIDFVDVDSDKWAQYSRQKNWPMSALYRREGELLLEFERRVAQDFDAGLFVSSTEAELFRSLAPESADKTGFFNNGVNAAYFAPDAALASPFAGTDPVLVFTGAMDYWPNIDAVVWFADSVFPKLRQACSDIQFCIVGSSPSREVRKLADREGITVTGRVPDVRPYLQHAALAIAPMRIARGVQNKVLEAMAMARPVVVSAMGLEGIDAVHGKHLLVADGVNDTVAAVQALLARPHENMGAAARARVVAQFSWDDNLPEVVYLLSGNSPAEPAGQESVGV